MRRKTRDRTRSGYAFVEMMALATLIGAGSAIAVARFGPNRAQPGIDPSSSLETAVPSICGADPVAVFFDRHSEKYVIWTDRNRNGFAEDSEIRPRRPGSIGNLKRCLREQTSSGIPTASLAALDDGNPSASGRFVRVVPGGMVAADGAEDSSRGQ